MKLSTGDKVALLMHEQLGTGFGKLGHGMLRYSDTDIVALIDSENVGGDSSSITGIPRRAPIVGTVGAARALGAEILIIGIAPSGGLLPDSWRGEVIEALRCGMSVVNPLHTPWSGDPEFSALVQPGKWIWDVRVEPPDLLPGTGAAASLKCKRLLAVGTDMSVGKMTAALEMAKAANAAGIKAAFVATGQVGICIAGSGVPLDAVRLDYASGAIEREVLRVSDADLVLIEGQGALCHPASTANLALMRGAMPTHLLFVHRARQETLKRMNGFTIPDLMSLIRLNEDLATCCGTFPRPKTIGIALNCAELNDEESQVEIDKTSRLTGLPVTDPVKFGCDCLLANLAD